MMFETVVPRPEAQMEAMPPAAPKMSIRHLDFFYGKFQGLKDINLDIADRRVTAFIGPSGCGKSTLLRTFNRMYSLYPGQRAVGEILFNGQNILAPGSTSTCCAPRSAWCSRSRRRFRCRSTTTSRSA